MILQAVASRATGSVENNRTLSFVSLPLLGPLPSMATTPSITQKRGLTSVFRSTSIVAKSYGSCSFTWYWLLIRPGTHPSWFFTAPVNLTSGCVLSFGRFTRPSESSTPLAITKLLISSASLWLTVLPLSKSANAIPSSSATCFRPALLMWRLLPPKLGESP